MSRHYVLGDFLVDATFPALALELDPPMEVLANLGRLAATIDAIVDVFPPKFEVLSGYRDARLNDACREAGLPASVASLHLNGCAADVRPLAEDIDPEQIFDWLRDNAERINLHEAVYYPKKGFIHVAVVDHEHPTPRRILMRM